MFSGGLESSEKVVIHICSSAVHRRRRGGGVAIRYDARKTPIHATNLEGINDLMVDGYEVDDDRLPATKNKPIPIGNTDRPLYKEGQKWSGIDHRRVSGY